MLHIDLFAGAGGFSAGARAAGFRTVAAVDHDTERIETLRLNHPDAALLRADIRQLSAWSLIRLLPRRCGVYRPPDLLTASPPCQPFSTAGTTTRRLTDERLWLFREAVRLAAAVRPRVLLIENVPGIVSRRVGPERVIDHLRSELDGIGYRNRLELVLNAADHGVPQRRIRWFLLATADGALTLRGPKALGGPVTVREALAGLPPPGESNYRPESSDYADLMRNAGRWELAEPPHLTHHRGHRAAPEQLARYSLVRPGQRVSELFSSLDPEIVAGLQRSGILAAVPFKQTGYRLVPGGPSPAVLAAAADRLLHPHANRAITVREAARLQSFPDAYRFAGGPQSQYRQIGDAVPPLLAWHLAVLVRELLGAD